MHIFFNKFITCNSSLIQFVKQYNNCLESKKQKERESDAADFLTIIPCAIKSLIETQFQHVSTHAKFREVQVQIKRKVNCITRSTESTLDFTVYEILEQVSNSKFNKLVVTYDAISCKIKCQYLLFESKGILCHHCLSALSFERSKNVKRMHTHIKSSHDEPLLESRSRRFDDLMF
ncbi:hypothetical protein Ahy_B05g079187 isoform B [Arachis hypogaea]|uniref:Protein FAR1-RELATED SEQUENCE n=1 Tax=Arachis hypogaea TaxID=3818 RepID=A0A444Z9A9_ARAHY|nr:hypothetical protein Ahy_B05g079187 isoform B [Arachis hypogaea]